MALIVCIDYQLSFVPEHRQTRYAFWLGVPLEAGGFMGDLKPDYGVREDVRLIYFSQSAD